MQEVGIEAKRIASGDLGYYLTYNPPIIYKDLKPEGSTIGSTYLPYFHVLLVEAITNLQKNEPQKDKKLKVALIAINPDEDIDCVRTLFDLYAKANNLEVDYVITRKNPEKASEKNKNA